MGSLTHRDTDQLLTDADRLVAEGATADALDLLLRANRARRDPAIEQRLVGLRHQAATEAPRSPAGPPGPWPAPGPDVFVEGSIPEVHRAELTAAVVRAALAHRGCLLVRGLLPPQEAAHLLDDVHEAFAAAERNAAGAGVADTTPWYVPFEPRPGHSFGALERTFARTLGGVLTVESPRTLADVIDAFQASGMGELLEQYFGEWPALSAKKSTLRRASADSPTEWHQDGAFLGTDTRTLNAWVALTPCGVDAPSIDVVPQAFEGTVETGTDDALFAWSVSSAEVRSVGRAPVRPVFEPGDALLFDQLTLHRTGVDPTMTHDRYAIESWFFAPSTYPVEQVPILF